MIGLKIRKLLDRNLGDYSLSVSVSEDGITAYITMTPNKPPEEITVLEDDLRSILQACGIKVGINDHAMKELVALKKFGEAVKVAEGTKPVPGQNAVIKNEFPMDLGLFKKVDSKGNVDFKELNLFTPVIAGQILAKKIPAEDGIQGQDLFGRPVPAQPGKDTSFRLGKNVNVSPDGLELISGIDGRLEVISGLINVNNVFTVKGDVDASTGNIRFTGDVMITGDIKTGYSVECDGNLEVNGVIEAAEIKVRGNLVSKGGIQGNDRAQILVGGDMACRYIENATVDVNGNLITDFILHSTVSAGSTIKMKGKKGMIVGGHVCAKTLIEANIIGTAVGTRTVVEVGVSPALKNKIADLKKQREDKDVEIRKLAAKVNELKLLLSKGMVSESGKQSFTKLIGEYTDATNEIKALDDEIGKAEQDVSDANDGMIIAKSTVYTGVIILIGSRIKHIKYELSASRIIVEENNITVAAL